MPDERPPERDETRPMEPVDGDSGSESAGAEPATDETRAMRSVDDTQADGTRPMDAVDRTAETRPRSATETARIQPSGGPRSDDREGGVWTGRAEVRPPRPGTEFYESDWADTRSDETTGRWWAPIAVGSAALLLLGLLGYGISVIVQNSGDEDGTPATAPATVATTTTQARTTAATTEPTTAPTSPSPSMSTTEPTTEPANAEVTVPALRGMPVADAQAALQRTGLGFRVIRRESDAEPGTVIDSDPPEGSLVPSDTRITLVVATEPTNSPATTTSTSPPTASED
jgi:hypothetical protein